MTVADEIRNDPSAALSLADAAALFPAGKDDRPVCRATLDNWAKAGVAAGRRRVRLETAKVGGKRYTTLAAVQRFFDEQNAVAVTPQPAPAA